MNSGTVIQGQQTVITQLLPPSRDLVLPDDVKEPFDIFWMSHCHGYQWRRKTCAVVDNCVFYNDVVSHVHVETQIIQHINAKWAPLPAPMHVNIYMNYSPCGACAMKLIEQLNLWGNVTLEIHVAGLYNIARASCVVQNHSTHVNDSSRHGLKQLLRYGQSTGRIVIKTFDFGTWTQLLAYLTAANTYTNRLVDLYDAIIVPEVPSSYPYHTRAKEDMLMRQDLNILIAECNIDAIIESTQLCALQNVAQ